MTQSSSRFHRHSISASQFAFVSLSEAKAARTVAHHPGRPPIWVPLLMLGAFSCVVRLNDLDLSLQRKFWSSDGWYLADNPCVQFLHHYGTWPALIAAGIGLFSSIISFRLPFLQPARTFGGFLALAMILGPGLVINVACKDHFGRPRPKQVQEFGGSETFHPLGKPTFHPGGRSFPSGHAAMGFFWFAPCIYLWRRHRRVALGFAALALAHGGLMSFGRMAQGAHWFSDSLWAAGMVYACSWVLHRWFVSPISLTSMANPNPTQSELTHHNSMAS